MNKPKEEAIEADGTVTKAERGSFIVTLENGHSVNCKLCGKIRKHFIRIVPGDKVKIEVSPYDFTKGRIIFRER